MDERQPDGGVEPTPAPGGPDPEPDGDPLYKFGDSKARIRSLIHTGALVVLAFLAANVLVLGVLQALVFAGVVTIPPDFGGIADLPTGVAVTVFAFNFVGYFVVGLGYLQWRGELWPFDTDLFDLSVPGLRDLGVAAVGLVGLFVLLAVASSVLTALGIESSTNTAITTGLENPVLLLYFVPIAFLLNGPAEEFLFRGIVQGLFRDAYGVVPGILASSAVFGVVHFLALSGGNVLATLAVIGLLGVVLGVLYEVTDNLVVPSLVHGAFNAVQFLAIYASATGAVPAA
jgi:hypothetical protein